MIQDPDSYLNEYKRLEVEVLDSCNLRCKLCNRYGLKSTSTSLSPDDLIARIEELQPDKLLFMGHKSEPTLYQWTDGFKDWNLIDLIDIIQTIYPDLEVELYTNGSSMPPKQNEKFWTKFNELKPITIYWCVAGINENDHQKYRGNRLRHIIDNVNLNTNHLNIALFIMFKYNHPNQSNPSKPVTNNELKELAKDQFFKPFDNIIFIHSGDIYARGNLETQDVHKYIVNDKLSYCLGATTNFVNEKNQFYFCKYFAEVIELNKINEEKFFNQKEFSNYKQEEISKFIHVSKNVYGICDKCKDFWLPQIQDKLYNTDGVLLAKIPMNQKFTINNKKLREEANATNAAKNNRNRINI